MRETVTTSSPFSDVKVVVCNLPRTAYAGLPGCTLREAIQTLARENIESYMSFFFAPFSCYRQVLDTAQSIVTQGVETAQRVSRQGVEAAQQATENERLAVKAATK